VKKHLHIWFMLLFLWALGYDLIVWGAAGRLPVIGEKLRTSAQRNAMLATAYMAVGGAIDAAVPPLADWGTQHAQNALSDGFPRIKDDPNVAMDLILSQSWNSAHTTLRVMYWAAPALGVIAMVMWARRPRKIKMMGGGR